MLAYCRAGDLAVSGGMCNFGAEKLKKTMKKLLMIVDPQVDFITGSLPVPGAAQAMDALSAYIRAHAAEYHGIIVTGDRHPFRHFSFREEGGPWPRHCVHDSVGAAVWPALMDALYDVAVPVTFLYKGLDPRTEEYSIFKNEQSAAAIDSIVREQGIGRIDVCGLAGDVCVSDTLTDGIALYGPGMFGALPEYSPSLDGGGRLTALINENSLTCTR